ncbi:MAG: hypothetical protein QF535_05740 [Anaerolineales bacterium]|nr:hypothetical protein [Anaerolineales bacterium]
MKIAKKVMRYCPFCKKHTEQKQELLKTGGNRGQLKAGQRRHERRSGVAGYGGMPQPKAAKKAKTSHKTQLRYKCAVCSKSNMRRSNIRAKKMVKE